MQDDAGEFELAFRSYTLGAALARTKRLYDPQKDAANANSLTLTYTHDAFSTLAKSEATVEPIFIIAPPRSGTTLLSQLLTQHRNVSTVGESNLAQAAMMPIRGFSLGHVSAFDGAHGANGWTRLGDTIARLLAERAQSDGSARIVDKTLNTLRLLGPLSIAVPRAKFIRLTRDPRDVATSCFRTYFTEGLGWTFSLEHIASPCQPRFRR
ncbi:MAG: sulfotransferase [Pseudomonadota bacterium]